ncbi:hypothetical protein I4U23_018266 [Adineta vaga]|nr:hypothetical protein I4U23_018266 [Adineta vaga]
MLIHPSATMTTNNVEQEVSSITTTHHKVEKWIRISKRIVQFFRLMRISKLRRRFIDIVSHHCPYVDLEDYQTNKVQEDLLFLDDVDRYHEVFNTFSSFGFTWQDKEFQLAKLKANYIYDRYMSISEIIAKTNIPIDMIPSIYNRMNSPKMQSSLIYLNLFNDAEKFIQEKLLMIYMREDVNCFIGKAQQQTLTPIMNRIKPNQITNDSVSSYSYSKMIKTDDKSQYDEILIPNWTYSTMLGVVYNPIHEKVIKRNKRKNTKALDSNINTTLETSVIVHSSQSHISTAAAIHRNQQGINRTSRNFTNQHILNRFNRSNIVFPKPISDKKPFLQTVFICKAHSSSWSDHNEHLLENET